MTGYYRFSINNRILSVFDVSELMIVDLEILILIIVSNLDLWFYVYKTRSNNTL